MLLYIMSTLSPLMDVYLKPFTCASRVPERRFWTMFGLMYKSCKMKAETGNGGLLHPPPRDNRNYTDRRTDYAPRGLHSAPEGCRRPEVEASQGGIMQSEGYIICPEGGVISIGPRRGVQ